MHSYQKKAAEEFVRRILPRHYQQVSLLWCEPEDSRDVYEIGWQDGKLILKGNSPVSIAAALGWYLKDMAGVNLSWCGSHRELPESLPEAVPLRHMIEQKYRVYLNYCTVNYSASWWDWERWEKEIDYMALNGVNMPLCSVGIEAVWYDVLLEMGMEEDDIRQFLCGPAFSAWQWMTNIEGFAGPMPKSWIDSHLILGQKIMERVLELGMMPIQQGFSGYIPKKMAQLYPDSRIQRKKIWWGVSDSAQLDPADPLFEKMGGCFFRHMERLYGLHGYYAADPFHESQPPVEGEEYLQDVGRSIEKLMLSADRGGIWVMQAWSVRKGIACAVSSDRLLILDLNGQEYRRKENFWGYPFVTGVLHNFGGRIKLHGDMGWLAGNRFSILREEGLNVCGSGLFMEGIGQNPVYYDLAFEMLTAKGPKELGEWIKKYVRRRYGTKDLNAEKAWDLLLKTVYAPGTNEVETSSIVCARPAVEVKKSGPNEGFVFAYGNDRLVQALKLLRKVNSRTEGYYFDLVDILRQALSNHAYGIYRKVSGAFLNRNLEGMKRYSGEFLELLEDLDEIVDLRPEYRFRTWVSDAVSWGSNAEEQELLEYNATALLTIWGPDESTVLFDYAWREWSGLIGQYYAERWKLFFGYLQGILERDEEYVELGLPQAIGRESWRANAFYEKLADFELSFICGKKRFEECSADYGLIDRMTEKYFS